jgi:hypothetical protein
MAEWEDLRREARRLEASLEVSAAFSDCNRVSARNVPLGSSLQQCIAQYCLGAAFCLKLHCCLSSILLLLLLLFDIAGQSASVLETCTASEQR